MKVKPYQVITACSFLIMLVAGLILSCYWKLWVHPMIAGDKAPLILTIDKSTTASRFVALLKEKELIDSPKLMFWLMRYENAATRLKAGVYEVKSGESAIQFLRRVVAGDVLVFKFPIIPGTTQEKISADLAKAPYLSYQADDWSAINDGHPQAEGMLLADTYQYQGGSSSSNLLAQGHQKLLSYLNQSWANRASELPYRNEYELLVAASIIEKESAVPAERRLISGVIVNRLKLRMPLQMDPTVIYALGPRYHGTLSHEDMLISSPYNSYRVQGLPPTPIAMVGKEAIDAAAHPEVSKYLYFVAKGDGTHQFSENYNEQRKAINKLKHKEVH